MTNLIIFMTPFHRKMGLWGCTCTRRVTHQFYHQISYLEPDSMKRSQITLLRGQLPPPPHDETDGGQLPPWWDRWRTTPMMRQMEDNSPHDETDGGQPPWWDRWRTTPPMMRQMEDNSPHDETDGGQLPPWWDRWRTTPPMMRQMEDNSPPMMWQMGDNSPHDETDGGQLPPKHLHSSIGRPLHDNTKCGCCM